MARYIRINAHCVFLLDASCEYLGTARGEFARLSEGDYLCDSCSGWMEIMGASFCHSGPSRKSGGGEGPSRKLWAFLHVTSFGPISAHVGNMQPHARAKDTGMNQTLTPLPSRGNQVLGQDRYEGRLFQPSVASALMAWTQACHFSVLQEMWRTCTCALSVLCFVQ